MAWKLSGGNFKVVPEGTHVFKVTDCKWDEDFGKLEFVLETSKGYKHIERFGLLDANGEVNEKANNAYSFFARTVLNDMNIDEIEHSDLVGKYIEATVEHDKKPNRNDPTKTVTFVKLGAKKPASGFNGAETPVGNAQKVNLDDLLG
jgi:hypothetical protein